MKRTAIWPAALIPLLLLAFAAVAQEHAGQPALSTPVHVIDGDSIEIEGQVIDIYGIDAPELGQSCLNGGTPYACGLEAAFALRKMIGVKQISCNPGQTPAEAGSICMGSSGDLAFVLLEQGAAVAKPGAPSSYVEAQKTAKGAGLGIWRGDFIAFPKWRDGDRLDAERSQKIQCPIKGVVEDTGRKVYLVPTDAVFEKVDMAAAPDSRLFCSDEQARAAGYKRPGEN